MSDNKLLKESTIRRFMKLANVESLTDNFISEMGMKVPPAKKGQEEQDPRPPAKMHKEETAEEEVIEEQDEDPEMDEPEADEDPMEDPAMDDMDMDDDQEMGAADISLTEEEAQLLIDLGERLKEAMGDAEEREDDDMDDLAMDEPGDDAAMGEEDMAGDEPAKMYEGVSKEDLVQEILKRVTKRIVSKRVNK